MYPFKIRVFDPELISILTRLEQQRLVEIPNRSISVKLTWNLKPIRPDLFLGQDSRYKNTCLGLKPFLIMETSPAKGHSLDVIFKKLL